MLAALVATGAASQTQKARDPKAGSAKAGAVVTSVKVVREHNLPAIEIVSTQPVVPTIQMLDSPPRLVIDLANAEMGIQRKRIPVQQGNILTVRAEQYQIEPPLMRIVVDLLVPLGFSWDTAGNRLMVRLKPAEDSTAANKEPAEPAAKELALIPAAKLAFVPVSNGIGEVALGSNGVANGTSLTAGNETLVLRLTRGGEVRVCPGSTVSVTPSKSAKDLMIGMSTGALETHYTLGVAADQVVTPDFRILFAGPGEFHYAISTDSRGNTCVRGLKGNTSSAIVSELIGDRIYQVKPREQVVFRSGRLDKVDGDIPADCSCPAPVPVVPVTRTDAAPAAPTIEPPATSDPGGKPVGGGHETDPLPPSKPDDVHIKVEAPLVFRAGEQSAGAALATAAPVPPTTEPAARPVPVETQVQPPPPPAQSPAQPKSPPRGFFRRVKGFFTSIFR